MINIGYLTRDPRFAQAFTVLRETASLANEGEVQIAAPVSLERFGTIQPASYEDVVEFLPEGQRAKNYIKIYCDQDILMADGDEQRSDIIECSLGTYRVAYSKPWQGHGYWFVVAEGIKS